MKPDDETQGPERETAEEAFLLQSWSDALPDSDADDVPEDILGLLDGTLSGPEAAAARERLARDPALAKAAGALLAEMRSSAADPPAALEPPGALLSEAIERGSRSSDDRPSLARRFRDLFSGSPWPGLAAGLAGIVVVAVLLRGPFSTAPSTTLRGTEVADVVSLLAPREGARLEGDVELRWAPVANAVRYRVVLADLAAGTMRELPQTAEPRLLVPEATLAMLASEEREIHWTVHVRLRDGAETSSAPGRFFWLQTD
jgi:hypothetical protein